jgi:hypothetical protein
VRQGLHCIARAAFDGAAAVRLISQARTRHGRGPEGRHPRAPMTHGRRPSWTSRLGAGCKRASPSQAYQQKRRRDGHVGYATTSRGREDANAPRVEAVARGALTTDVGVADRRGGHGR